MTTSHCQPEQLRLLLADQIPGDMQPELAQHLSECAECRQTLESLAGDKGWWTEVATCLQTHAGELPLGGTGSADHDDDKSFTVDFLVEFLEPSDQPEMLGRLGDYEIQEVIGRGGMGIVLKGVQRELGRFVAVKVMAPTLAASGAARQRFIREARAAAAIVHPNVMPIHSVSTTSRLPYLVMPFLACESLQQRIDRQGALEVDEILRIGLQVARGLAASHAMGLVHRDVKPANILLEKGVDRVMLTDFGLARAADDSSLTRTGTVTGTPQYMSPEQTAGEALDCRSDLFSLGSVLYAMCTGRSPFRAETALAVMRRISDTPVRPICEINPGIPIWLEQIVARLHEKSPDRRFQSATELLELLEQCLAHLQQPATKPMPDMTHGFTPLNGTPAITRRVRNAKSKWILTIIGCSMLILAIGVALNWRPANPGPTSSPVPAVAMQEPASVAPQRVEQAQDPRPFRPDDLPDSLQWNFQGPQPDFLLAWGGHAEHSITQLDHGLKVRRPPTTNGQEIGVAFEVAAILSNDFEVTLDFQGFKSMTSATDWRVPRVDISGQVFSAEDSDHQVHMLGINLRRETNGLMRIAAIQGDKSAKGDFSYKTSSANVTRDSGRLRLVRQDETMFYQTAPPDMDSWKTIASFHVDRGIFNSIVVGLRADDLQGSGEVILTGLSIRGQSVRTR